MANEENLKRLSPSEARENGRKGGVKSAEARRKKRDIKKTLEALMNDTIKDKESGAEYTREEAMALTLFSIALDRKHKQCIQAQSLIYRLTGQDQTTEDKKKTKLMLKQLEKDIELTQKKIDNADW